LQLLPEIITEQHLLYQVINEVLIKQNIMPKIPDILVGIQMERSVSVSSDFGWNIPTEIRRSIFDKPVLCPN